MRSQIPNDIMEMENKCQPYMRYDGTIPGMRLIENTPIEIAKLYEEYLKRLHAFFEKESVY